MKKLYIVSIIAACAIAVTASAQGYAFSANLSVGASGADVSALQTWLIQNGYSIPSIVSGTSAKGYFGSQTKAAVMKYQKAAGLPSTGFVGPLTRGKLNGASVISASTPASSAGATAGTSAGTAAASDTANPIPGAMVPPMAAGPSGLPIGITTVGTPGIMVVSQGPLSSSVLTAGQSMVPIMTVRVQASNSDIDFDGLVLDLGNDTTIYNKIFKKLYITSNDQVLFASDLNSQSVVSVSGQYVFGTAGYDVIVPKGSYKDIVIKADLNSSIDSTYLNESPWYISIDSQAVSALDGAGVFLYGPSQDGLIVQALTINKSVTDTAQANVSLDAASPLKANVPVTDTTNGQYNGLPVLVFGVNAQNDNLHLHEVKVNVSALGTGSIGAAYLYNGSTLVTSATVSSGVADFTNITDGTNGASIPVNTTGQFTVKVDASAITSGTLNVTASTSALTIYNSIDGNAIISGSAQGNTQTVSSAGPLFTLAGTPTITKQVTNTDNSGNSTTTYAATFTVNVQAVGQNVELGLPASTTLAAFGTSSTGLNLAQVYKDGSPATGVTIIASYSQPTGTALDNTTSFVVSRNQSITIPVTYSFVVKNPGADVYAMQVQGINAATGLVNFMANQPAWRTSSI